ncbi:HTH_Tnp_Tc3_2 domain-containing protein [Trichonephila clavipes]|nr:HTH_Tnp_Tc3_2 domain-containing protein [Trichonephila clavipes]
MDKYVQMLNKELWRFGQDSPGVYLGVATRGKRPCPESRELERRALVGKDWKRVLDGENVRRALRRETWSEFGVCNNRIVMAQRKHLDDILRGRIIGRLECERTQLEVSDELGIAQSVISRLWQRFQDDGLREAVWSNRHIGRHLGRSDMVVARCWQQWITEGRVYRRGGSGRPRNTNDREDRAIRRVATSAPTTSLASIQRHLPPSRHPVPSRETIRRRLTEVGLRSRRPLRRLPLTPHHRQCRLDFADLGQLGSVTDWRRVIFSDESRFSLSADDHRTRVWRRSGQRSDPAFIVERHTAISQGVTVWGAISWDTRSSLVVLQGTLTARRYVDDILTPIVLPMISSRPGAIYQQDNARPHTVRLSQQCLQGYDVLPWPARSRNRSCLGRAGKATAAVPRYRRINCAEKTMAGSSTGGHK